MRLRGEKCGPLRLRENNRHGDLLKKQLYQSNSTYRRRSVHASHASIVLASCIIAGCAASMGFASTGTSAVSSDTVTTRFSLAAPTELCVKVVEEWDARDADGDGIADCAQELHPSDRFARTIRLANTSDRACYAIAQVAIPAVSASDKTIPLLTFDAESSWKLWGEPVYADGENKMIWTFLLQDTLAPHHESSALFKEMIVQEYSDADSLPSISEMQIVGYAMSTDMYECADDAWQSYISSGGLGEEVQWLSSPRTKDSGGDDGYDLEFF